MLQFVQFSVTVGDILTSLSILIAALTLGYQLSKDRQDARRQQANEVRTASAKTLSSLERWAEISLYFFDQIQPLFVETSQMMQDRAKARDFLYKKLQEAHAAVYQKILDEKVIASYVEMYKFNPAFKPYFEQALNSMELQDNATFNDYLRSLQDEIFSAEYDPQTYEAAVVGNSLRKVTSAYHARYKAELRKILDPVDGFLSGLISRPDDDLLIPGNLKPPGI